MTNTKPSADAAQVLPVKERIYEGIMTWLGLRSGTPLKIKLDKLAYLLLICAVILVLVVFAVARFKVTEETAIYAIATVGT